MKKQISLDNDIDIREQWEYICKSGKENPDSKIGVFASDANSYQLIWSNCRASICSYHNINSLNHRFSQPKSDFNKIPPKIINPQILTSRIRIARNLSPFRFPSLMNNSERLKICNLVRNALQSVPGFFYYLNDLPTEIENKLRDKNFFFENRDRFLKSAGIYRDWPQGRAIFITEDWQVCVWINEEDHVRIMSIVPNYDLKLLTSQLLAVFKHLEARLSFAYSEQLGFLTSCPSNLGTGCRISIHAQCRGEELEQFKQMGLQVRSLKGESYLATGDIYDISVRRRLGITESDIMNKLYKSLATWLKNKS